MNSQYKPATTPEELSRLVVDRVNTGDAAGVAALYEPQAVVGFPSDNPTVGRDGIQALYQRMIDAGAKFEVEDPLPTLYFEDLALTATRPKDGTGGRSQILRRQADGTWLRVLDRPEAG